MTKENIVWDPEFSRSSILERLCERGVVFRKTIDAVSASSRCVDPESSLETINGGFYITGLAVLESLAWSRPAVAISRRSNSSSGICIVSLATIRGMGTGFLKCEYIAMHSADTDCIRCIERELQERGNCGL